MTNNKALLKVFRHFGNNQHEMSRQLGTGLHNVHNWISGSTKMNKSVARYIADNVDCDVTYEDLVDE